jgi:hypothetical protein
MVNVVIDVFDLSMLNMWILCESFSVIAIDALLCVMNSHRKGVKSILMKLVKSKFITSNNFIYSSRDEHVHRNKPSFVIDIPVIRNECALNCFTNSIPMYFFFQNFNTPSIDVVKMKSVLKEDLMQSMNSLCM